MLLKSSFSNSATAFPAIQLKTKNLQTQGNIIWFFWNLAHRHIFENTFLNIWSSVCFPPGSRERATLTLYQGTIRQCSSWSSGQAESGTVAWTSRSMPKNLQVPLRNRFRNRSWTSTSTWSFAEKHFCAEKHVIAEKHDWCAEKHWSLSSSVAQGDRHGVSPGIPLPVFLRVVRLNPNVSPLRVAIHCFSESLQSSVQYERVAGCASHLQPASIGPFGWERP